MERGGGSGPGGSTAAKGSALGAGNSTVCDECAHRKENKTIKKFYRTYEIVPDRERCLLKQGIVCMGIATRDGCGALCPQVNMPCTGCYGPPEGVLDQGAKMVSALGSVLDIGDCKDLSDGEIAARIDAVIEGCRISPAPVTSTALRALCWGKITMKQITISPITRLEGHGKIEIFLDADGNVANAYLQVPELRGFEQFCVGRRAEDMPVIMSRICGVCPEAHHLAATKALDRLFAVDPPPAAKKIRELLYMAFYVTDHTTHFYALGGPTSSSGPMRALGAQHSGCDP